MKLNIICAFIKNYGFAPTIERIRLLEVYLTEYSILLTFVIMGAYGDVCYTMKNEELERKCEK